MVYIVYEQSILIFAVNESPRKILRLLTLFSTFDDLVDSQWFLIKTFLFAISASTYEKWYAVRVIQRLVTFPRNESYIIRLHHFRSNETRLPFSKDYFKRCRIKVKDTHQSPHSPTLCILFTFSSYQTASTTVIQNLLLFLILYSIVCGVYSIIVLIVGSPINIFEELIY